MVAIDPLSACAERRSASPSRAIDRSFDSPHQNRRVGEKHRDDLLQELSIATGVRERRCFVKDDV